MFCGTGEMGLMAAVMCRSVYYVDNNNGSLMIAKQTLGTWDEGVKKVDWCRDVFLGFEPTDGRPCHEEVVRGLMTEERRAQRKLQRELNENLIDIGHSPAQGAGGPEQAPARRGKKGKEAKGGEGDQPIGDEEDEQCHGDGDSGRKAAPPPPKEKPAAGPAAMEVEHAEGKGDDSAKPVEAAEGVGGVEEEKGGEGGEGVEDGEGGEGSEGGENSDE
jgi:hypothetical protein